MSERTGEERLADADNPAIDPNFGNLAFSPGHGSWKRSAGGDVEAAIPDLGFEVELITVD